jgi:hypothetical protein
MPFDPLDDMIRKAVRIADSDVPAYVETRLLVALHGIAGSGRRSRPVWWIWGLLSVASAAAVAGFFIMSGSPTPIPAPIEIRTELEVPGRNIRIIWVQKEDFVLRRNR